MGITQAKVKAVAHAFGFTARWDSNVQEWRIASKLYPTNSYFTDDNGDAIDTILASYRFYRRCNLAPSILIMEELR
jgi:hypothetical protein